MDINGFGECPSFINSRHRNSKSATNKHIYDGDKYHSKRSAEWSLLHRLVDFVRIPSRVDFDPRQSGH